MLMDPPDGLVDWLDEVLSQGAVAVRVTVGIGKSMTTVAMFAVEEHADKFTTKDVSAIPVDEFDAESVVAELSSNGWPEGTGSARLYALVETKAQLRTHQVRKPSKTKDHSDSKPENIPHKMTQVVGRLCLTVERMADKMTDALAITSDALGHREAVLGEALEAVVDAKTSQMSAESEALEAYIQMQEDQEEKETGDVEGLFERVLGRFAGPGGGGGGSDSDGDGEHEDVDGWLKDIDDNPELFETAIQDERFMKRFAKAFSKNKARGGPPKKKSKTTTTKTAADKRKKHSLKKDNE